MRFEARLTYEKRENKAPAIFKFDGLSVKIWIKFKTKSETYVTDDGNSTIAGMLSISEDKYALFQKPTIIFRLL